MSWDERDDIGTRDSRGTLFCPKCERGTVYLRQTREEATIHCLHPRCHYAYSIAPEGVP